MIKINWQHLIFIIMMLGSCATVVFYLISLVKNDI